ncbi:MAG: primosomal protein N' [Planctomycetales bacterium]|nr:primosomal protein N' [Planctomycetales bacterium]
MPKDKTKSLFGTELDDATSASGRIIRVALDTGADSLFDYILPEYLGTVQPGRRVQVPFGKTNNLKQAFVVEIIDDADEIAKCRRFKLKSVKSVLDDMPLLGEELIQLAQWIGQYYVCPLGQVFSAMVPSAVKKDAGVKKQSIVYLAPAAAEPREPLSSKKQKALHEILQNANAVDPDSGIEKSALLEMAECTEDPLRQLMRRQIVKVARKEVLSVLPVVPQRLMYPAHEVILNDDQQAALNFIANELNESRFGVSLLHGVTDSGKTEVYIRAIQAAIAAGRRAIVLLPEIALTAQTVQRFSSRFEKLAVLHSHLSGPQRNAQWQSIKNNQADVVIGARSAIFAPVSNLGLVVIDEEHEGSYKQDTVPRYHGRDVAIKRAQLANAHCILGSATPSLETLHNCKTKKHYTLLMLPKRVMDLPLPEMKLVNMLTAFADAPHKGVHLISPPLWAHISKILERKEQAILLLNRRGYSNFVYCPSCRHSLTCRNCDVTLTFHKKPQLEERKETILGKHIIGGYAVCHYCLSRTLVPKQCPLCGGSMTMIGIGSQRLEEELRRAFPSARICRIDSDSMAGEDYYKVLRDFSEQKIDILAGTQMLAKGLHFPNVTLVGIISADTALFLPDFRSNERTFQLISQVAGRAGRSEKKGTVYIQTFFPDQPAIKYALQYDFNSFIEKELEHRKACFLPPFGRMAVIAMRDIKFDRLKAAAEQMRQRLDGLICTENHEITLRGPLEPAISRIQRQHRLQFILLAKSAADLQRVFERLRCMAPLRPAVQTQVDMDPVGVL